MKESIFIGKKDCESAQH